MTPERKAWWDSLSKEEKQVRRCIAEQTAIIIINKFNLRIKFTYKFTDDYKTDIRTAQKAIKALRKQIAMRPVIKKDFKMFRYCPTCDCILNVSKARPFCDKCGQKLRWG